jgi:hypothetical protein
MSKMPVKRFGDAFGDDFEQVQGADRLEVGEVVSEMLSTPLKQIRNATPEQMLQATYRPLLQSGRATALHVIVLKQILAATIGDNRATAILFDRLDGRPAAALAKIKKSKNKGAEMIVDLD